MRRTEISWPTQFISFCTLISRGDCLSSGIFSAQSIVPSPGSVCASFKPSLSCRWQQTIWGVSRSRIRSCSCGFPC